MGWNLMAKGPAYIREYRDRHGINRIYFRRKGYASWPLRQPLRSPEFWEDYEAAMKGETPPGYTLKYGNKPEPRKPAKQRSLRWLIEEYKTSAVFRRLAPKTRMVRARILDYLSLNYGDYLYAGLNQRAVLKLRDQKAAMPEAANARVKAIRQVYKFALEYGVEGVEADPTRDVPYLQSDNPDGFHGWTTEEVEQFEQSHPMGTKARLALGLMLYAGCARRSDVIVLGKQHLSKDGRLQYKQFKGRNKNPVNIDIKVIREL